MTFAAVYDTTAYFQEASVPTAIVSLHNFCFTAGRTPVERHWRLQTYKLQGVHNGTKQQQNTSAKTKQSKI